MSDLAVSLICREALVLLDREMHEGWDGELANDAVAGQAYADVLFVRGDLSRTIDIFSQKYIRPAMRKLGKGLLKDPLIPRDDPLMDLYCQLSACESYRGIVMRVVVDLEGAHPLLRFDVRMSCNA